MYVCVAGLTIMELHFIRVTRMGSHILRILGVRKLRYVGIYK